MGDLIEPMQIRHALCREMANAETWVHVEAAFEALLTVRRMQAEMEAERNHLGISDSVTMPEREQI